MKPLEDELRSLLRRREPPEGFTDRVMERLARRPARRPPFGRAWGRRWVQWAAVAAIVCLLVGAGLAKLQRRREGEAARVQAMLALHIASAQLNGALRKVVELPPWRAPGRGGAGSE
jgi:hypothetical protein